MTRFMVRPGLIVFQDSTPGSHATMFGPHGAALPFRMDASCFSGWPDHDIEWAFEYEGPLKKGTILVFATADRESVGEVAADGEILMSERKVKITRDKDGVPVKFSRRFFR